MQPAAGSLTQSKQGGDETVACRTQAAAAAAAMHSRCATALHMVLYSLHSRAYYRSWPMLRHVLLRHPERCNIVRGTTPQILPNHPAMLLHRHQLNHHSLKLMVTVKQ
jgi:hypothetical protein